MQPEYVVTPLLRESGISELSGIEPNPTKHPVRIVAAEESSKSSVTPVGVRVYGIDGVELTDEDLTGVLRLLARGRRRRSSELVRRFQSRFRAESGTGEELGEYGYREGVSP